MLTSLRARKWFLDGFTARHSSLYDDRSSNAHANGHTTPGIDIIDKDAELRRLREEIQTLWQIIHMLFERDRTLSRPSSSF